VVGGAADSKIEIADFTGLFKLHLDGGGGVDDLKVSTGESLLKITDSTVALGDSLDPIAHKGFESLSALAVTDVVNTFDGSLVRNLKLTLDGGSKDDTLLGGWLDDVISGGLGNDKIAGSFGHDTILEEADADFVVGSDDSLIGLGTDAFSGIEMLKLTGGPANNILDASKFRWGPVLLDGAGGHDVVTGGASADVLMGGVGNDVLSGNQGDDSLLGDAGNDLLIGGAGIDVGDGGDGTDTGKGLETRLNLER
jgi:Ca2+-binding RTX toxin-like protein